ENKIQNYRFYEDRNFQRRTYECSSDCSDIHIGCFVVYDRPNYMGNQVFLRRGEYSDFQCMGSMRGMMRMAMMDTIRSCRMIPMHRGQFRMRIYERENFRGQMHKLMVDCESLQDRYYMSDCQSCNVMDGHWLMFEQPGEYRDLRDMGLSSILRISSIRRNMEMC
uniref:Beta/gamma crystallin 'Greek key' domain-containing protein n=1 Tax=Monopterus albus TaxID=43700 RepID=A0A3Q3K8A1_MONAL